MPAPIPDPAKQAAILALPAPVPPGTFEIGLVLGGTVSAGAYTAGALDLLVQALDNFQTACGAAPPHQVKLQLAAGSSGGAVCAAILGISLNRPFVHAVGTQAALTQPGGGPGNNMLWDIWVNQLSFVPMLDTTDLQAAIQDPPPPPDPKAPAAQHVPALLNGAVIDNAVKIVVDYANQAGPFITRPWAAAPFRIATTVCNLRGMPFAISLTPSIGIFTGSGYVEHDDFAWFAIPNAPDGGDGAIATVLAREFWLSRTPAGIAVGYQILGDFARASGSMPIGLPARPLSRPAEHYIYRPAARVDDNGNVLVDWPQPDWTELADVLAGGPYSFTGVDGGTLNNNPVQIAHDALTGVGQHNPPAPQAANRALLLIDPLTDQPTAVAPVGLSAVAAAMGVVNTFIGGARYLTSDLALFQNADVFSRFQLVPSRTDFTGNGVAGDQAPTDAHGNPLVGEGALAGSDFSALLGWCAPEYRVHDFLLGRMNMATYLRRELTLCASNPLFDGWMANPALVNQYAITKNGDRAPTPVSADRTSYYLPIIPLPDDNFGVFLPAWPTNAFDPATLKAPIAARVQAVLAKLREDNLPGTLGWLAQFVALDGISDAITNYLITALTKVMTTRKLYTPPAAADA
jgi:hypothetical protein